MVMEFNKSYYSKYYVYKWLEDYLPDLAAAREIADNHDAVKHSKKPVSSFGLFWK